MSIKYTELIEELRRFAVSEREVAQMHGLCLKHADMIDAAADAIETLSSGIETYAKANAELVAWKNNAQEWMQKVAEEKEGAARRDDAAARAAEAAAMYADKAAPAPVWIATRKSILEDAEKCVCGHREDDYGSPEDSFATIAELWTAYNGTLFTPVDVAMMMALLKIARIAGGRGSEDSFVDLAGYAACGGEIWSKREAAREV